MTYLHFHCFAFAPTQFRGWFVIIFLSFCLFSGCQLHRGQQSFQIEEQNAAIRAKIKANNLKSQFRQKKNVNIIQKQPIIMPSKPLIAKYIPVPSKQKEQKQLRIKSEFSEPRLKSNLSFMEFLTGPVKGDINMLSSSQFVPPPATSDTIRVGLLLPLTGPNAGLGGAMLKATQLAMLTC